MKNITITKSEKKPEFKFTTNSKYYTERSNRLGTRAEKITSYPRIGRGDNDK